MQHFKKYHSVLAFLVYIVGCQFKTTSFIDGTILTLMFAYVVVELYSQHVTQPDYRKETLEALAKQKEDFEAQIKFIMSQNSAAHKAADKEIADIKAAVAKVSAVKTVGMTNTRF